MASSDDKGGNLGATKVSTEAKSKVPLSISTSEKGPKSGDDNQHGNSAPLSKRSRFLKFGSLESPSVRFQRIAEARDQMSRAVPSSYGSGHHLRERLHRVISNKIDWGSLWKMAKQWIRNPRNMALFVWILAVAASGAIMFLIMTETLDAALPKKRDRDAWFEVNNQILNALFTLMCLYQHPKRMYHFVLLIIWRPEHISRLRKVYCKNGTYKPHEWAHMMVIVVLLNINCFAQYALCGLNVGYKRSQRPVIGVTVCISFALAAPAIAGLYSFLSPLGKDYDSESDEEAQVNDQVIRTRSRLEKRFSFASRDEMMTLETRPTWSGGVLDFCKDLSLAYLSLFCSFCIFGWNMERLGFGNMYVHIASFLLFCMAPFWIFTLAAINVDHEFTREALGVTGIVLCVFGLLYGGFWRIQIRKRFNLPTYNFCCGNPAVSDCTLWLFCCCCSLAQEVRTGNSYDVVENKFYKKEEVKNGQSHLSPLPRDNGALPLRSDSSSPPVNIAPSPLNAAQAQSPSTVSGYSSQTGLLPSTGHESLTTGNDETMTPPVPSLIQRDSS